MSQPALLREVAILPGTIKQKPAPASKMTTLRSEEVPLWLAPCGTAHRFFDKNVKCNLAVEYF